ncbi:hypothetical protein COU79_02660 [Candidatus Peregrinibacteria bacterium CG10_big_fil_rev_8_21_14_0_10_54_7]|nr:MAG: hypothetical protein COU79_02660 [Candidatus Peregrinibacteria bacterium CG10_big_fil_rev_8_21_14_0_10_54_7]
MSFIQDFQQLLREKPRYNVKHVMAENCDFSDTAIKSKNCYYCFCVFYCEDVYYARYSRKCTSCSGRTFCVECEWCTECSDCAKCYGCGYCRDCQNCSTCQFCSDCFGCKDCFGCVGLHQKQYCLFNEQLPKDEYRKRMQELHLKNNAHRQLVVQRVEKLRSRHPNLALHQFMAEDSTGDHLTECKGCYQCYDAFACEDCLYNIEANGNRDCSDITVCFETEGSSNCVQAPLNYNCHFLMHTDQCNDCEFCAYSKNLKHCFGCVYLADKEYHILNKPYSPEEYAKEMANIRKELSAENLHNMGLFFVSDYERNRFLHEEDSCIQSVPPFL